MKNILKYIFSIFSLSVFLFSCIDEDKIRYELDDFERLVNMRIESSVASFDATNAESQTVLTFYSENNSVVDEVELFLEHYMFLEDSTGPRVSFMTVPGSNIKNDGTTKFTVTLTEMTEALGITPDDLAGGDILTFYNITRLTNGRVYPDTVLKGTDFEGINIAPTISQSSSTTSFTTTLRYPIVCELQEGFATGRYLVEVEQGINTPFGGIFGDDVVVNIEATSNTGRTFTIPYLSNAVSGFTARVNFEMACNIILVPETSGGLQCGIGLAWNINTANPGTFDIGDDSEFTISFLHNILGDCGLPASDPFFLKLTKQ